MGIFTSSLANAAPPPPIARNDYSLEFYQGPLIGPIRVMGLSGAYTGYAEGIDGALSNAASPAVREPFSYDWFDWDIDVDFSLPGSYGGTDFDNRGPQADPKLVSTLDGFFYLHGGLQAQFGAFGVSTTAELFQYDIRPSTASPGTPGVALDYGRYNVLAALFGDEEHHVQRFGNLPGFEKGVADC